MAHIGGRLSGAPRPGDRLGYGLGESDRDIIYHSPEDEAEATGGDDEVIQRLPGGDQQQSSLTQDAHAQYLQQMGQVFYYGSASRWSPFKQLARSINSALASKSEDIYYELEAVLKKHKTDFLSLLRNPMRSPLHRDIVQKASTEGILLLYPHHRHQRVKQLSKMGTKTVVSQDIVDEALLMSEMFDLNELAALELIIAGENYESRYPGLSRGPVAVLLYYDGRLCLLQALRVITQARAGRSWSSNLPKGVARLLSSFCDELQMDGLVMAILDQLLTFDVQKEFEVLAQNRALGPSKYRKRVHDLLEEIRLTLAEILFNIAAQSDFGVPETDKLIHLLATRSTRDQTKGCLDPVATKVLMSLLYHIDVSLLQTCDESDPIIETMPLVKYRPLIEELPRMLNKYQDFTIPEIKPIVHFAWCLAVKTLLQYPPNIGSFQLDMQLAQLDEDRQLDGVIDEQGVFEHIYRLLVINDHVHADVNCMRQIHTLLTDFITLAPLKLKEMQGRADEVARILQAYMHERIQPMGDLPRHFEHFILLLAEFYTHDKYDLSSEFWTIAPVSKVDKSSNGDKTTLKHTVLNKFVRTFQVSQLPIILQVPVIKFYTALAKSHPFNVYNLIKAVNVMSLSSSSSNLLASQKSGYTHAPQFSLDYFFSTLHQFFNTVRALDRRAAAGLPSPLSSDIDMTAHLVGKGSSISSPISELETETFNAILELLEAIAGGDRSCSLVIAENHQYGCIQLLLGLLLCPIPRLLKANILKCLAAFAKSNHIVANSVWLKLDVLIPKPPTLATSIGSVNPSAGMPSGLPKTWVHGMALEIDDIEPRLEEYPITVGVLNVISALFDHISYKQDNPQLQAQVDNCLNFVISSIILKAHSRNYKRREDKLQIIKNGLEIITKVISTYEPSSDGIALGKSGFTLMAQILQDSQLFRCVMETIEELANYLEHDMINASSSLPQQHGSQGTSSENFRLDAETKQLISDTALRAIELLNVACGKQLEFMEVIREVPGFPYAAVRRLEHLFNSVNPKTGLIDRYANLMNLFVNSSDLPKVQFNILHLLRSLCMENSEVPARILQQCSASASTAIRGDFLTHQFVDCLESPYKELRVEALRFISSALQVNSSYRNFGISHMLLGFDAGFRGAEIRDPGTFGQVFTCLHAILSLFSDMASFEDLARQEERDLSLEILVKLCSVPEARDCVLRYIRSSNDFIVNYLFNLDKLKPVDQKHKWMRYRYDELYWFLKIVAFEIRQCSSKELKNLVANYIQLLFGEQASNRRIMAFLVDDLFYERPKPMPPFEYFDASELTRIISECASGGKSLVNLKALHHKLSSEIKSVIPHLAGAQARYIEAEMTDVLKYATDLNSSQMMLDRKVKFFESWRELMELILQTPCLDFYEPEMTSRLLLEFLHTLLKRLLPSDHHQHSQPYTHTQSNRRGYSSSSYTGTQAQSRELISNLVTPITSLILLTTAKLVSLGIEHSNKLTDYLSCAKSLLAILEETGHIWTPPFKRARMNLYSTFLYLIKRIPQKQGQAGGQTIILNQRLLEKVFKDVLSGHEIGRVLALTFLVSVEDMSYLPSITMDGTLKLILEALLTDDRELKATRCQTFIRAFYAFEAKVAFLLRVANYTGGSKMLLHLGIVDILSSLQAFETYPVAVSNQTEGQEVSRRVYIGVMRLALTMYYTTMTQAQDDALNRFALSKSSTFVDVLRIANRMENADPSLETVRLTVEFLSRTIAAAPQPLQTVFINLINDYSSNLTTKQSRAEVASSILMGCVRLCKDRKMTIVFAPTIHPPSHYQGASSTTAYTYSIPSLSMLVSVLHNCSQIKFEANPTTASRLNTLYRQSMEAALFILYHHLNLYLTPALAENLPREYSKDIESLAIDSQSVLSDTFFAKVEASPLLGENGHFSQALCRRIKRIVRLKQH